MLLIDMFSLVRGCMFMLGGDLKPKYKMDRKPVRLNR